MRAPPRCVVVDDHPDVLKLTLQVIRTFRPQAEVIGFDSSVDALCYLRVNRVHLVLTDYQMPLVDGFRLIAAVRLVDRGVPIVMMSGEDIEMAALTAGAAAFILKSAIIHRLRFVLEQVGFGQSLPTAGAPPSRSLAVHSISHDAVAGKYGLEAAAMKRP